MRKIKSIIFVLTALFVVLNVFSKSKIFEVPQGKVGVKTVEIGILEKKGIQAKDYSPGEYKNYGFDSWELFDSGIQTIEINVNIFREKNEKIELMFKLIFSIRDNSAHKIYMDIGSGKKYHIYIQREIEKIFQKTHSTISLEKLKAKEFDIPIEEINEKLNKYIEIKSLEALR